MSAVAARAGVGHQRAVPALREQGGPAAPGGCATACAEYLEEAEAAVADERDAWTAFADFMAPARSTPTTVAITMQPGRARSRPTEELYAMSARAAELNDGSSARTKAAGGLRADVVVDDLSLILEQVSSIRLGARRRTAHAELRQRYLALFLDGLRDRGRRRCPGHRRSRRSSAGGGCHGEHRDGSWRMETPGSPSQASRSRRPTARSRSVATSSRNSRRCAGAAFTSSPSASGSHIPRMPTSRPAGGPPGGVRPAGHSRGVPHVRRDGRAAADRRPPIRLPGWLHDGPAEPRLDLRELDDARGASRSRPARGGAPRVRADPHGRGVRRPLGAFRGLRAGVRAGDLTLARLPSSPSHDQRGIGRPAGTSSGVSG